MSCTKRYPENFGTNMTECKVSTIIVETYGVNETYGNK